MTALEETIAAIEDDLDRARARVGQLENALEALRALTAPPRARDTTAYSAEALDMLHPGKRVTDSVGDTWQKVDGRWAPADHGGAVHLTSAQLIDYWGPIR